MLGNEEGENMEPRVESTGFARRAFLKVAGMAALGGLASYAAGATENSEAGRKPNVVLIMADDLGYGDVGCYGATLVDTPNIDSLAEGGMRFTDAHTPGSTCTPTRWGLLTGRYPECRNAKYYTPLLIPTKRTTLASVFKEAGYRTGCVGKWHLGFGGKRGANWNGEIKPGPLEVGFDYYFGVPLSNNKPPFVFVENHRVCERQDDEVVEVPKYPGNQKEPKNLKIGNNTTRKEDEIGVKLTARGKRAAVLP